MDSEQGLDPWNAPAPTAHGSDQRRASGFVWTLGAVEVLLFGCCSLVAVVARSVPLSQLQQQVAAGNPQISADQVAQQLGQLYPRLMPLAVLCLVVGFLPGLAYVLLGFGVRAGRSAPINTALLLAITQIIVVGVVVVSNTAAAVMTDNLPVLTTNIVGLGSLVMLLGFTIYWLLRAKRSRGRWDQEREPWNNP